MQSKTCLITPINQYTNYLIFLLLSLLHSLFSFPLASSLSQSFTSTLFVGPTNPLSPPSFSLLRSTQASLKLSPRLGHFPKSPSPLSGGEKKDKKWFKTGHHLSSNHKGPWSEYVCVCVRDSGKVREKERKRK